jgi:hypothetical protein
MNTVTGVLDGGNTEPVIDGNEDGFLVRYRDGYMDGETEGLALGVRVGSWEIIVEGATEGDVVGVKKSMPKSNVTTFPRPSANHS